MKYAIFFQVKWLEKFMSGMLCVGGGVLLSTVFVHMIPEVRESFELAQKGKKICQLFVYKTISFTIVCK